MVLAAQKIQGKRVGGHGGELSYLLCLFIMSFCLEEVASKIKGSWNYTPLMTNGKRERKTIHCRKMIKEKGKKKSFNSEKLNTFFYFIKIKLDTASLQDSLKMLCFCLAEIILGAPKSSLRCCQKFQWWIVVNISKTLVISAKKNTMWDNCVSQLFLWNRNNFGFY